MFTHGGENMAKGKYYSVRSKRGVKGSIFATSLKEAQNLARRHGLKVKSVKRKK
jgi:hypothetical protein